MALQPTVHALNRWLRVDSNLDESERKHIEHQVVWVVSVFGELGLEGDELVAIRFAATRHALHAMGAEMPISLASPADVSHHDGLIQKLMAVEHGGWNPDVIQRAIVTWHTEEREAIDRALNRFQPVGEGP